MDIDVRSFVHQFRYQRAFRSSVSYTFISKGETLMSYKQDEMQRIRIEHARFKEALQDIANVDGGEMTKMAIEMRARAYIALHDANFDWSTTEDSNYEDPRWRALK